MAEHRAFTGPSFCFHSTVLIHFIRMTHELQLWLVRNGLGYIWIQRQPALFFIRGTTHKPNTLMFPKHTLCLWDVQFTASEGSNQRTERQTERWLKRLVERDNFWVLQSCLIIDLYSWVWITTVTSTLWMWDIKSDEFRFTSSRTQQPRSGRRFYRFYIHTCKIQTMLASV